MVLYVGFSFWCKILINWCKFLTPIIVIFVNFISDQLNKFKYNFEMILEGEMHVDKLQEHLTACEARETKLKKELQKATKKNNCAEARQIEIKIMDNRSSLKTTQSESKCK